VCGKASGKCESSISQAAVHWQWEKPNKADKAAAVHLRVWAENDIYIPQVLI